MSIAIPSCYIGGPQLPFANPVYTSQETISLWQDAKTDLESLGAEVIVVNEFPALQYYENSESVLPELASQVPRLPDGWNTIERGQLIAHAWNNFLTENADPTIPSLSAVNKDRISPAFPPHSP